MKVKCIKYMTIGPDPQEMETSPFLTKGKEYVVLMISRDENNIFYYIQEDSSEDSVGGYFDARQFIVTSNYIPNNWIINVKIEFNYVGLLPKKWYEHRGFFDKLHDDDDPAAIELFFSECNEIYRQEELFGK